MAPRPIERLGSASVEVTLPDGTDGRPCCTVTSTRIPCWRRRSWVRLPDLASPQVLRPMMQGRFAPSNERFQPRRHQSQSRAPVTISAVPELSPYAVSVQADGLQFVFPGVGDRRVLRGGQHEG